MVAWLLRFRPSPATLAWRHGAEGERGTARMLAPLERHGWAVMHDLAVPGVFAIDWDDASVAGIPASKSPPNAGSRYFGW